MSTETVEAVGTVEAVDCSAIAPAGRITFKAVRESLPRNEGESAASYKSRVADAIHAHVARMGVAAPAILAHDIGRGYYLAKRVETARSIRYTFARPPEADKEKDAVAGVLRGFSRLTPEQRERAIDRIASL